MRGSTTAWAAALAVMSMNGQYTKAEAAPARKQEGVERPKYYFPRRLKRSYSNSTSMSLTSTSGDDISRASTPAEVQMTPTPEAPTFPRFNPVSYFSSLFAAGEIPETTDSVVTTTFTLTSENSTWLNTATYTITYTETDLGTNTSKTIPLTTSTSIPSTSSVSGSVTTSMSPLLPTAYSSPTSSSSTPPSSKQDGPTASSDQLQSHPSPSPSISSRAYTPIYTPHPLNGSSSAFLTGTGPSSTKKSTSTSSNSRSTESDQASAAHTSTTHHSIHISEHDDTSSTSSRSTSEVSAGIVFPTAAGSSNGLPISIVLPTFSTRDHSSSASRATESSHSIDSETMTKRPLPSTGTATGSTGFMPVSEPSPTAPRSVSSSKPTDSTTSHTFNGITVGLSTYFQGTPTGSQTASSGSDGHPTVTGGMTHSATGGISGIISDLTSALSILGTGTATASFAASTASNATSSSSGNDTAGGVPDSTATVSSASGILPGFLSTLLGGTGTTAVPISGATGASSTSAGDESMTGSTPSGTALLTLTGPTTWSSTWPVTAQPTATGTAALSSVLPSVISEVSSLVSSAESSVLSEVSSIASATTSVPASVTAAASNALSSLASSLSSELSGVVATVTDSAVSSSLASQFSSMMSSAASSLASELSSALPTSSVDTSMLSTVTGSSGTTLVSASGSSMTSPSYTLSTSTGPSGSTAVPVTVSGSTTSTSIPLSTGTTMTLGSSGTASLSSSTSSGKISSTSSGTTSSTSSGIASSETMTSAISSANTTIIPIGSSSVTISYTPTSLSFRASSTSRSESVTAAASSSRTATSESASKAAPTSIVATGTDSATSLFLPTSLVYQPSPSSSSATGIQTQTGSSTSVAGLPTSMPGLVQPPNGLPPAPTNTTLIQVGFNYGLNYPFVVNSENTTNQIFKYLPQGVAYGLGVSNASVLMNALLPYDTSSSMGYITTIAQAYVPSEMVTTLQQALHAPNSNLYSNPDPTVNTLMGMINPTIPLLPGASLSDGASASAYNPAATASSSAGDGAPIGGDSSQSMPVKGTSVGISVGAVAGAAVYATAMIYVARRYRLRRTRHQRVSSVPTAGEMTQASGGGMGGFFMSGGNGRNSPTMGGARGSRQSGGSSNGRSVREQGISHPIMAENSLGWN